MLTWIAQTTSTTPAGMPITLGVSLVLGLFLLVMGRKLVRVAVTLCGLVVGAAAAFVLADALRKDGSVSDGLMLVWMIGGGVIGLLGAWFLFRGWMALSMGALASLLAPAAVVIWTGTPEVEAKASPDGVVLNAQADPAKDGSDTKTKSTSKLLPNSLTPTKDGESKDKPDLPISKLSPEDLGITKENIEEAKQTVIKVVHTVYDYQRAHIQAWWTELKPDGQRNMTITLVIAALAGGLLGFVLPYFSASIQTAMVGGAMLLSALSGLIAQYAPDQSKWLPTEPRALLITVSLITLVGVIIQWTLWRRAADK